MRVKVLFIAGAGRSGSTLLDRLLGQSEEFFSCGEMQFLWKAGYGFNQLCSCGVALRGCGFWGEILKGVSCDSTEDSFIGRATELTGRVGTRRSLPFLLMPSVCSSQFSNDLVEYKSLIKDTYEATASLSGAQFLVDSSLDPTHALILRDIDGLDVRVLHLVRDPRAVAYSRLNPKKRTSFTTKPKNMPRSGILETCVKWSAVNYLVERLFGNDSRYYRISYEELISDPLSTITKILNWLSIDDASPSYIDGNIVELRATHTSLGNPNKFVSGKIELKNDDRWRAGLQDFQKIAIRQICSSLMLRYGYD